jgi:hypothetical protein
MAARGALVARITLMGEVKRVPAAEKKRKSRLRSRLSG